METKGEEAQPAAERHSPMKRHLNCAAGLRTLLVVWSYGCDSLHRNRAVISDLWDQNPQEMEYWDCFIFSLARKESKRFNYKRC